MSAAPLLEVEMLHKAFGGLVAVERLAFSVAPGEIVGLIGPNGSGKTTVLNLVSGVLRADAGSVRLQSRDIAKLAPHKIARLGVGRTFQLLRTLPSLTCLENVLTALAFRQEPLWGAPARALAQELLARTGLGEKQMRAVDTFTYVDQKRLELARALALAPSLLLLDEWLAGLNSTEREDGIRLVRELRDEGIAIVLVEHAMDAVRALCDRCIVMDAGRKIAEGRTDAVLADPNVISAYLGQSDA